MSKKTIFKKKQQNPVLEALSRRRTDNQLIRSASKANLLITCMVLHDKFGYGKKRTEKFISEYHEQLEAYNSGYIEKAKDFEDVLWDECGIKIEL